MYKTFVSPLTTELCNTCNYCPSIHGFQSMPALKVKAICRAQSDPKVALRLCISSFTIRRNLAIEPSLNPSRPGICTGGPAIMSTAKPLHASTFLSWNKMVSKPKSSQALKGVD